MQKARLALQINTYFTPAAMRSGELKIALNSGHQDPEKKKLPVLSASLVIITNLTTTGINVEFNKQELC